MSSSRLHAYRDNNGTHWHMKMIKSIKFLLVSGVTRGNRDGNYAKVTKNQTHKECLIIVYTTYLWFCPKSITSEGANTENVLRRKRKQTLVGYDDPCEITTVVMGSYYGSEKLGCCRYVHYHRAKGFSVCFRTVINWLSTWYTWS